MKKMLSFMKKYWIIVWICVDAIGLTSFWAYAEYIELHNSTQKVIANTADKNQRFSSDHLDTGTPAARIIGIPLVNGQTSYDIPIKIWNYDATSSARFYPKALNYTLYAQLVDINGDLITDSIYDRKKAISTTNVNKIIGEIGIKAEGAADYTRFSSVTYSGTDGYSIALSTPNFTGTTVGEETVYQKGEHIYYLNFPSAFLTDNEGVYVKLTAQPSAANSDLSPLYAILSVSGSTVVLEDGWTGKFNDDENVTASNFDGFNYVISGNGSANITFRWDSTHFDVSQFFLNDNSITPETEYVDSHGNTTHTVNGEKVWYTASDDGVHANGWMYFTMHVHSDEETIEGVSVAGQNRYDIQLYMTGDNPSDYDSWEKIKSYVDFDNGNLTNS